MIVVSAFRADMKRSVVSDSVADTKTKKQQKTTKI